MALRLDITSGAYYYVPSTPPPPARLADPALDLANSPQVREQNLDVGIAYETHFRPAAERSEGKSVVVDEVV